MIWERALVLLGGLTLVTAQITVYGQLPLGQTLSSAPFQTTTVLAAYNTTRLRLPPRPEGELFTNFAIQLEQDALRVPGISIPHVGPSFWGFSIEMSVINQVLGKNSTFINVPFLNLMANLQERAGGVLVRLGGNTQEYAILVPEGDERLHPGTNYGKGQSPSSGTTLTPAVLYTMEMFYTASNISALLNVKWFMGIPFDDPVNWRTQIAEEAEAVLGDNLLGLQIGNEPDFYVTFSRRQAPYGPQDYHRETGDLIRNIAGNDRIPRKNILIGPSTSGQNDGFHAEDVFATGWLDEYQDHLYALTVEHYPMDNCVGMYGGDPANYHEPQDMLPRYLNHDNVVELVRPYSAVAQEAITRNKAFIMFETNTASCGGFPGISNTYVAAIWGADYGLQMAYYNFTHAMMHVGGQNVFYNPFTSPRTEHAAFNEWTVGPIFYSAMVLAEALGKTNTSKVVDLFPNRRNPSTPGYAIYENDKLSKVALFNYLSDDTGASDLSVILTLNGGVPASVNVKYLLASSIIEKDDITWAGQTFGNQYEADGRLQGTLNVTNIPCDRGQNICIIPVPAPGLALVFFEDSEVMTASQASQTFATTVYMKPFNTATWDKTALETSNGHSNAQNNANYARTNFEFRKLHGAASGRQNLVKASAVPLTFIIASTLWFFLH